MNVPFFRPSISEEAIAEVTACLRSGWLTTGPRTKKFEQQFAEKVGAKHAVALNSCTAGLHLALDAVGLKAGEMVIVPTFTFAATAEVVRYFDATPVFVDADDETLCLDIAKTRATLEALRDGRPVAGLKPPYTKVRAIIPMHYAGQIADVDAVRDLAKEFDLAVIEDAAHCMPAYAKGEGTSEIGEGWRSVGTTADITCFSFYANKCITTGEGGMAVTDDDALADRMRVMSLHGMSKDAWRRFDTKASWYYEIVAPGFKYNLTDIASSVGLHQLRRANELWAGRAALAEQYTERLKDVPHFRLPHERPDRKSSWHLYPIRVQPSCALERGPLIDALKTRDIGTSVHWMPLHMHPYYTELYGFERELFPVAASAYEGLISLPLFFGMTSEECDYVCDTLIELGGLA